MLPIPTIRSIKFFFIIANLSHGNFTVSDPTTNATNVTTTFTLQAVLDGQVQFNHDGTRNKPSYSVSVTDGRTTTAAQPAAITFDFEPELTISELTFDQNRSATLGLLNISASDVETLESSSLIFEVENVTAGHFAYASNLDLKIEKFLQLFVVTGSIRFVQNGSYDTPSFSLCAFDGMLRSPWYKPQIYLNHIPEVRQTGDARIQVTQGEDFHFTLNSLRFSDPDGVNDTLTYRAQLKGVGEGGGSPLPPEIRFAPPDQFFGNIPGVGSYIVEVQAIDPRGLAVAGEFVLASEVDGGINIQKLYTSLSSIFGVGVTVLAYLWLRRRIATHRRRFPFVNDLRKVLNLEYYDLTRFDGDAYKTILLKLQWDLGKFYGQLTPQEKKCFAVCVGEILTKRGLVSRSGYGGGLFGVCCLLNVGWPNELNLSEIETQSSDIAAEAISNWKSAVVAERESQQPLNRWPYFSPTKCEKLRVFCCCGKPSSADRWRPADNNTTTPRPTKERQGVALTELKTREGAGEV